MRKGLREALERFMDDMAYVRQQGEEPMVNAVAAVRLFVTIRDRLGGLESALADDPTDNAPTLAAVVAAQGEAIQGLRLALEEERRERLALNRDLHTVEAVLMEERQMRVGCNDPGRVTASQAQPVVPEWAGMDDFGGSDYPELPLEAPSPHARTGRDGWLVEPVPVTIIALPDALIPHVSMVQWANDPFVTWWCAMWPAVFKLPPVQVEAGQRVGVRPDGRLEVVP